VASVSVGKLTCKASGCQKKEAINYGGLGALAQLAAQQSGIPIVDLSGIGDGMANALTTALKATNCFDIQEREVMEDLQKEAELSGIKLEIKPSDYLISGAITTVALEATRSSFGGGFIPIIGGISKTTQTAKLGMDLRIVEIRKANVKASKSFSANSESSSWGAAGGGLVGGGALFGAHSVTKSPEMDKVATETILYAVGFLVDTLAGQSVVSRPTTKVAELKSNTEDTSDSEFSQP
jgi:curli biogenesis system outer membrane secretion channel CsgG